MGTKRHGILALLLSSQLLMLSLLVVRRPPVPVAIGMESTIKLLKSNEAEDRLAKAGELCVTWGPDPYVIIEHHKARAFYDDWDHKQKYYCPAEDFKRNGIHGMLFTNPAHW
jgi:hypothetical protein